MAFDGFISTLNLIRVLQLPGFSRDVALQFVLSAREVFFDEENLEQAILEFSQTLSHTLDTAKVRLGFKKAEHIIEQSRYENIHFCSFLDQDYPTSLLSTPGFPLVLNYKGDLRVFQHQESIALIGTRSPSEFSAFSGRHLGELFSSAGFNIVSGLALGCDTSAHQGALKFKGKTTAVLAHGLESIYPIENMKLAGEILSCGGVLISEYFYGEPIKRKHFIERDRIQAGLSKAVIVIETGMTGGTMHTVNFAKKYKRILACLWSERFEKENIAAGNKSLIGSGAFVLQNQTDVNSFILELKSVDQTTI